MLAEALARMPHSGPMRLVGEILAADTDWVRCRATDHRAASYPLRIDGVLYGATMVEIGAQAAAVHASLFDIGGAHTGLILALSNIDIAMDVVDDDGPIEATAERISAHGDAANYRFAVKGGAGPIVSGELLLSMRRQTG